MKDISVEPNLKFKRKSVENNIQLYLHNNRQLPLPTEIEISESGTCNRKCVFCPRSAPGFEDKKIFIDPKLVEKLSLELNELSYSGVVRFSGFVEPLLDKKIFDHIETFRDVKASCKTVAFGELFPNKLFLITVTQKPNVNLNSKK